MNAETRPTGTQAIERSILLLKLLTTRGQFGWGLTDLARRAGLEKATVHRILACLESERMVERDIKEHRYFPGPMLVELGLSVTTYPHLLTEGRAAAARLAQRVKGVGFFYLRSGLEFVVAARVEQSVNRGMLNEEGFRRPLLMSAGGVAMLIAMPRDERDVVIERNLREMAVMGVLRPERFLNTLERSLKLGYTANLEDVVPGINSFAKCVLDRAGTPLGAFAIAGDPSTLPAEAGARFDTLLCHEAVDLGDRAPRLSTGRASAALAEAKEEVRPARSR